LDYSYGVVYQDQGSVLSVALVNRSGNAHTLEKLCVVAGARCKGVGTGILDMVVLCYNKSIQSVEVLI
jgi:hypothetical protein